MNWTEIIVAVVAAAGGFFGAVLSNNKQLAIVETKLDAIKEDIAEHGRRIDAHNHLNERVTKLEVLLEERRSP